MIDQKTIDQITQQRLNCLCTKHLHVPQRVKLNKLNRLVDFFAIGVPLLYLPVRFLAKDTAVGLASEVVWEILAAMLLVLTFLKINQRWQERAEEHSSLLGENIAIAGQADNLLRDIKHVSPEAASLFFLLAQRSEAADRKALGEPTTAERQRAYREGLKEAQYNCPHCSASPWKYVPGPCQACGNKKIISDFTPISSLR